MAKQSSSKAAPSKENNIVYIFAYLLTWLSGIIVYITEGQKNKRMKFHALQAIFLGIIAFILWFIPFIGWIIGVLLWLYGLYVGYRAYENEDVSIPVLGDWAKKYS